MARAFVLIINGFGIGGTQDAHQYGDVGANTLGRLAQYCVDGKCDTHKRQGKLNLPNLNRLGLGIAALASTSQLPIGLTTDNVFEKTAFGYASPQNQNEHCSSGYWEMVGVPQVIVSNGQVTPPSKAISLLDQAKLAGKTIITIGEATSIFRCQENLSLCTQKNMPLFNQCLELAQQAPDHSLVFANVLDVNKLQKHQFDATDYVAALETLDAQLPLFEAALKSNDLVIITANHGYDPTYCDFKHTREHVPVLAIGLNQDNTTKFLGRRDTLADIGQSIAAYLQIAALPYGVSFL